MLELFSGLQILSAALLDLGIALQVARSVLPSKTCAGQQRTTLALLALGLIGTLFTSALVLRGEDSTALSSTLWPLLLQTHSGAMLLLAAGAGLLATARSRPLGLLASVLLLLSRAASGHAADSGLWTPAVALHALHLLMISLWVGSVLQAALQSLTPQTLPAQQLHRLSQQASVACVGVLLSGLLNLERIQSQASLWPWQAYDGWLSAKLVAISTVCVVAAYNRWYMLPGLLQGSLACSRRFILLLRIEALLLMVTVVLAAQLGATMPGATS
jgi:putative copper export protein